MYRAITLSISHKCAEMSISKCSSELVNIATITRRCQSVDDEAISAVSLKIVKVDINQGFTMVWLIEIECTLDSGVIPIKVNTSASGIKINVCSFWNVIIVIVAWLGELITGCAKDSTKIEIKESIVITKSCSISRASLSSGGEIGVF